MIGAAQRALPGLRPCGSHSPSEAAAWAVLSQRVRIVQAARLRGDLIARHGDGGAFPAPSVLRASDLDLPGRKAEHLRAVAEAALDGLPAHERRLDAEVVERYGPGAHLDAVAEQWRPFRTWAVVHLRSLREQRTREIGGAPRGAG